MSSEQVHQDIEKILKTVAAAGLNADSLAFRLLQPTLNPETIRQYLASLSHQDRANLFYSAGMLSIANARIREAVNANSPTQASATPPVQNNGQSGGLHLLRQEPHTRGTLGGHGDSTDGSSQHPPASESST